MNNPATPPATDRAARIALTLVEPPVIAGPFEFPDGSGRAYTTVAQFLPASVDRRAAVDGTPDAAVFTLSYLSSAYETRPVCFAINGGPGASATFLNLGALGPRRAPSADDASLPLPPHRLESNESSWLDRFDLVFIDPVETGYSIVTDAARSSAHSVDGDVSLLTDVICAWLNRHGRWSSEIHLVGESYGALRCAAASDRLLDSGVLLSSLILVSPVLDYQALVFSPGNDLPFALHLPAMAGVAHHHGRIAASVASSATEARAAASSFVDQHYAAALLAGSRLSGEERAAIVTRLAQLTGLPESVVEEHDLRIPDDVFLVELLRHRGDIVGRLEARATGPRGASRAAQLEFDPSIDTFFAPYAAAMQSHLRDDLGVVRSEVYKVYSLDVETAWKWTQGQATGNHFASTSRDLARALRRNPHLQVFVGSGLHDLTTPYSATNWSLAHLDIPASARHRIVHRFYEAGHMFYTRKSALARFSEDVADWLPRVSAITDCAFRANV